MSKHSREVPPPHARMTNPGESTKSAELEAADRLIVALDVDTFEEAMHLVARLGDSVSFYKVGWQLFMGTHVQVPHALARLGKRIFLDLKMGDIPATVVQALGNMPERSLESLELMTFQGASSLIAAIRRSRSAAKPRLLMVTMLSSLDDEDVRELYGEHSTMDDIVALRAKRALDTGCDGLIASGNSVGKLRVRFGSAPLIVTPGIRPPGSPADDQKRLLTPFQAARDGADFLVVGRPIRNAADPSAMAERVVEEMRAGLAERARSMKASRQGVLSQ